MYTFLSRNTILFYFSNWIQPLAIYSCASFHHLWTTGRDFLLYLETTHKCLNLFNSEVGLNPWCPIHQAYSLSLASIPFMLGLGMKFPENVTLYFKTQGNSFMAELGGQGTVLHYKNMFIYTPKFFKSLWSIRKNCQK